MFKKKQEKSKTALLLGGGGARAAYQVGVLKAIAEIIPEGTDNPFPIICGTSAGSINAAALASNSMQFHVGVRKIIAVWSNFTLSQVFRVDGKHLLGRIASWLWSNIGGGKHTEGPESLLDNQPLRELLSSYIDFNRIDQALTQGDLHAYCLTACSYTSGESVSFYRGHESVKNWQRTHREGCEDNITLDHLMASAAIPIVFPAVKIDNEYYGDGSMRQISPISPALHLGADKVLIIGLRVEEKTEPPKSAERPSLGQTAGYILDTLFLNSLFADVERLSRVNKTLDQVPDEQTGSLKKIKHLIISPSVDVAEVAMKHYSKLPKGFRTALNFLGMNKGNSRRFVSYLMFIESFCQELIDIGYADAMNQKEELKAFLDIQ